MVRISKKALVLGCVTLCVLLPMAGLGGPASKGQVKEAERAENPDENSTVLVEAFAVRVQLSGLYRLRVSPIGEKPDSVTVEDILKCLEAEHLGRVVAGAKIATCARSRGSRIDVDRRVHLRPAQPNRPQARSRSGSYSIGDSFEAKASVQADQSIFVSYAFSWNDLAGDGMGDTIPPATTQWNWKGSVYLDPGKPSIVGAEQDPDRATFLILVADIRKK